MLPSGIYRNLYSFYIRFHICALLNANARVRHMSLLVQTCDRRGPESTSKR